MAAATGTGSRPFSILTGLSLVVGYALLGATWLVMKTEGYVRERGVRLAWVTGAGTFVAIGLVSLITPFLNPEYLESWFGMPNVFLHPVGAGAPDRDGVVLRAGSARGA